MSVKRFHLFLPTLVAEASEALADNRLRTSLSLLGVAIGIAAIIVVSSIASSGRQMVFSELETFGLRGFWVYRTVDSDKKIERDIEGSGINEADYKAIQDSNQSSISKLSPVVESAMNTLASKHGEILRIKLMGVNEQFMSINGDELDEGRFLTEHDVHSQSRVAVIGPEVVSKLISHDANPIGQNLNINGNWFVIVGVLRAKSRDLISSIGAGREETSARVLIPYSTQQRIIGISDFVSYLQGQAADIDSADEAVATVSAILHARHQGAYKYKSESMASYIKTANRILGGVTLIGVVAATVSLLVGGLAIMNIMTTSVIERTKEIGLRRAIGASKAAIQIQFLLEAVLISMLGGVCGVVLGIAIVHLLAMLSPLQASLAWDGLMLALTSTLVVGVVSGYYPALKASNLIPVEALRYE